jgi:phosphoribosylanthranilate isomerase
MTRVKICGVTRPDDARMAAELGAWAVGFVFWPRSPRAVSVEQARAIVAGLSPLVTPVGVFVDQTADEVNAVAARVGLGLVQLHGHETPAMARALSGRVIKAVALGDEGAADELERWPEALVLLDAHDPARRGGTGRTIDWDAAAVIARRRPVVLAGGLRPENVAEAVARVRPAAIDVSSGVETSPGVKDHDRMRALFAAVSSVGEGLR